MLHRFPTSMHLANAARPQADGSPRRPSLRLRVGVGVLIGGLCAGCLATPAAPAPRTAGPGRVAPSARPSATGAAAAGAAAIQVRALQGLVALPRRFAERAVIVSNNGGGVVSNNGGGIVSNNGGGIVSNNGGGIIADAGFVGKVRLALTQAAAGDDAPVPVAGTEVHLLDAAGQPVRDAAGKPLVAVTDAGGRYAFAGDRPARNLMIEVRLAAGWGAARALAPRDAGTRPVDVSLASSLATGYVLAKYVRTQADPLATLERLPADVEAETRARTAAALTGAVAAVETLTDDRVVAAVDALRGRDAALDAQMEVVRELLIVAGVSDLGAGRPATDVRLALGGFAVAPDGTRYLLGGHRVWRLADDGKLVVHAGNGAEGTRGSSEPAAVKDGDVATAVALRFPSSLIVDAQGRAVFVEGGRLLRVERDGTIRVLSADLVGALANGEKGVGRIFLLPGPAEEVWAYGKFATGAPTWWALAPGQAPRRVVTIQWTKPKRTDAGAVEEEAASGAPAWERHDDELGDYEGAQDGYDGELGDLSDWFHGLIADDWVRMADGKLRFLAKVEAGRAVFEADPASGATRRLMSAQRGDQLTSDGRVVRPGADIVEVRPSGPTVALGRPVAPGFSPVGAATGPDGTVYLYDTAYVLALGGGEPRVVAGVPPAVGSAVTAGQDHAFQQLGHLAPAEGGALYAADTGREQVVHVDRDRRVTPRAGGGTASGWGGARAQDVKLFKLGKIATDAAGRLYVAYAAVDKVTSAVIARVDADGQLEIVFPAAPPADDSGGTRPWQSVTGPEIDAFCVAPNGEIHVVTVSYGDAPARSLWRVPVDGGAERVADLTEPLRALSDSLGGKSDVSAIGDMAFDPRGVLHLCTRRSLVSWRPEAGLQVLVRDVKALGADTDGDTWASPFANGTIGFDAQGRCYRSSRNRLVRIDVAAGTGTVIAGPNGRAFAGTGVDDGLLEPGSPHLDAAGDLVFADAGHQQIKRIEAGRL